MTVPDLQSECVLVHLLGGEHGRRQKMDACMTGPWTSQAATAADLQLVHSKKKKRDRRSRLVQRASIDLHQEQINRMKM